MIENSRQASKKYKRYHQEGAEKHLKTSLIQLTSDIWISFGLSKDKKAGFGEDKYREAKVNIQSSLVRPGGPAAKVLAIKPDDLSVFSRIYTMEEEKWSLKVLLWPPHVQHKATVLSLRAKEWSQPTMVEMSEIINQTKSFPFSFILSDILSDVWCEH